MSDETPDDVATLYSWANLQGAKYRDFSGTRARARERAGEAMEAERERSQDATASVAEVQDLCAESVADEKSAVKMPTSMTPLSCNAVRVQERSAVQVPPMPVLVSGILGDVPMPPSSEVAPVGSSAPGYHAPQWFALKGLFSDTVGWDAGNVLAPAPQTGRVSALAEGMMVVDYAPGSQVAKDYETLAEWVRILVASTEHRYRGVRWSER